MENSKNKKAALGITMGIRGDLNDIKNNEEKKGGKKWNENNFMTFRNFLADIEIGDIVFRGEAFT